MNGLSDCEMYPKYPPVNLFGCASYIAVTNIAYYTTLALLQKVLLLASIRDVNITHLSNNTKLHNTQRIVIL